MNSPRPKVIEDFLKAAGWQAAARHPLPGDASTRRYTRLTLNGRRAMLLDQPQNTEAPAAGADATVEARAALGYNALARLAGADVGRFVAAAGYLRAQGLSAPEILADDADAGLALIEDLGDDLYADVLAAGGDEGELYAAAAAVLARLSAPAPAELAPGKPLHAYDEAALLAEIDLMTEWFFPAGLSRAAAPDEIAEHRALWRAALKPFLSGPGVFVHRDYHAQNLMWLPGRDGVGRVGLLDFQDAVAGSPAYDVISLTEDARRDVPAALADATVEHFLDERRRIGVPLDADAFAAEMAAFAAQRNAKIVGIFARLCKRDGKTRYLSLLPRVWGYLNRDLEHPALAGLKSWYERTVPLEARLSARVRSI